MLISKICVSDNLNKKGNISIFHSNRDPGTKFDVEVFGRTHYKAELMEFEEMTKTVVSFIYKMILKLNGIVVLLSP